MPISGKWESNFDTRWVRARRYYAETDELKDLGGWKSRIMVDRYAKFGTEHLTRAAARIESGKAENVVQFPHFPHSSKKVA